MVDQSVVTGAAVDEVVKDDVLVVVVVGASEEEDADVVTDTEVVDEAEVVVVLLLGHADEDRRVCDTHVECLPPVSCSRHLQRKCGQMG